jgi:hypothetical protein
MMASSKIVIALSAFFLSVGAGQQTKTVATAKRTVKVISIGYHSDTCKECNVLKAKMKKMNRKFLTAPIVFIKYNKTNKKTQAKSEKKLKKWGMLSIAKKEEGLKHVVLYNAGTKEAIVTLYPADTVIELEKKIKGALASVGD